MQVAACIGYLDYFCSLLVYWISRKAFQKE